jgi:hypothetical protein
MMVRITHQKTQWQAVNPETNRPATSRQTPSQHNDKANSLPVAILGKGNSVISKVPDSSDSLAAVSVTSKSLSSHK